jgi:hypothetical protein
MERGKFHLIDMMAPNKNEGGIEILHTTGIHKQIGEPKNIPKLVNSNFPKLYCNELSHNCIHS